MKKLTLSIGLLFLSVIVFAQNSKEAIANFQRNTAAKVTINFNTNVAEFVHFPKAQPMDLTGSNATEKAYAFIDNYKDIFGLQSSEQLTLLESKTDAYGFTHITLIQNHFGVPVYDGKLRFHFNAANKLSAINGNVIPNIKIDSNANISSAQAAAVAMQEVEAQNINYSNTGLIVNKNTLYIFQKGLAQDKHTSRHLVYEVEVRNNVDVREFVFVDAHSGEIVQQFTGMAHALNRTVYENNTGNPVWQEGDSENYPGNGLTSWQQNEVKTSAHTYYFFENAFGYTSYDNADAHMRTVNNDPGISCPNANWNGSTANYCNGTASDDVIGHEWGHAYTEYTSGLIYAWQSGAMNESYSDIWGETIDLINGYEDAGENNGPRVIGCGGDRWKIGEDASSFGGAIRDMWNPPCNGDPGKVTDGQYRCSDSDSGGVHSNSGIPNHAYALLVDGGTYNGQTIVGIGLTKAAHIFWGAQSNYLTATSNFTNLADALEASGNDLLGVNLEGLSTTITPAGSSGEIITASDLQQLEKAILAVELRINPDFCGFTTVLVTDTPDLCDAATTNPIFMEDWEAGMGSWTVEQLPENPSTWEARDWEISNALPGRAGNGIFGIDPVNGNCASDLENGIIRLQSPIVTIPTYPSLDPSSTFDMAFNHYVSTETKWDGGNIKYSLDGGAWTILPASAFIVNPYNDAINGGSNDNPMGGEPAFTGSDGGSNSGSWGQSVINLSNLGVVENSTIQFRFEMGTDGCNGREGWYIDELVIYNCTETLSVSDYNSIKNNVRVYPNPSNGLFTLEKTNAINLSQAQIHDINGRFIKTIDLSTMLNKKNIDISNLASGIYFMSVSSADTKTVIKLIKE
ncbi:MAG: M4 family metallopeptidase [Oceanihabitans sp.]